MRNPNTILGSIVVATLLISTCATGDGQDLEEIKIGKQTWALRNLDVSQFRNGDPIPEAKTTEEWVRAGNEGTPAWSYYDNDPEKGSKYGKLYNWFAVTDPRGLAPEGWHEPSNDEWAELANHVGGWGITGFKLMSTSGWADDGNGTNESGFTGLPGGGRTAFIQKFRSGATVAHWNFGGVGSGGSWWSSTESTAGSAWYVGLGFDSQNRYGKVGRSEHGKEAGMSVRVLRDTPSIAADQDMSERNSKEIKIGAQIWTARNLDLSQFQNGDPIPEAKTAEEWASAGRRGAPAWCHYDSDPEKKYQAALNGKKYGKLYNWFAVNDPRGLAPEGWHVPTDKEWTELLDYLRYGIPIPKMGQFNQIRGTERQPIDGGVNESGFAGLAGGYRGAGGTFTYLGMSDNWWSSTEYHSDDAWDRELSNLPAVGSPAGSVLRYDVDKAKGLSVRLVRN